MEESKETFQYGFVKKVANQKNLQGLALKSLSFSCDDEGPFARVVVYSKARELYEGIRTAAHEHKDIVVKGLGTSLEIRVQPQHEEDLGCDIEIRCREQLNCMVDFLCSINFDDDHVAYLLRFLKELGRDQENPSNENHAGTVYEIITEKETITIKMVKTMEKPMEDDDKKRFFASFNKLLEEFQIGVLKEPVWEKRKR